MHGSACADDIDSYNCACEDGYTGVLCETSMFFILLFYTVIRFFLLRTIGYLAISLDITVVDVVSEIYRISMSNKIDVFQENDALTSLRDIFWYGTLVW